MLLHVDLGIKQSIIANLELEAIRECVVHTRKADQLQQHMNIVDPVVSIREEEQSNSTSFVGEKFTRSPQYMGRRKPFTDTLTLSPTTLNARRWE